MFHRLAKQSVQALSADAIARNTFLETTALVGERLAYAAKAGLVIPDSMQVRQREAEALAQRLRSSLQLTAQAADAGQTTRIDEAYLKQISQALKDDSDNLVYRVLRDAALKSYKQSRPLRRPAEVLAESIAPAVDSEGWAARLDRAWLNLISPLRRGGRMRQQVIEDVKLISDRNQPGPLMVSLHWDPNGSANASSHGHNTYTIVASATRQYRRETVGCLMGHEVAHDRHLDLKADEAARATMNAIAPKSAALKAEFRAARQKVLMKLNTISEAQADADGIRFAARAGFDPLALLPFFEDIQKRNLPASHYVKVGYPTPQVRQNAVRRITAAENLQAIAQAARQTRESSPPKA